MVIIDLHSITKLGAIVHGTSASGAMKSLLVVLTPEIYLLDQHTPSLHAVAWPASGL